MRRRFAVLEPTTNMAADCPRGGSVPRAPSGTTFVELLSLTAFLEKAIVGSVGTALTLNLGGITLLRVARAANISLEECVAFCSPIISVEEAYIIFYWYNFV